MRKITVEKEVDNYKNTWWKIVIDDTLLKYCYCKDEAEHIKNYLITTNKQTITNKAI